MNIPIEAIVAQMEKEITSIKKENNIYKKKERVSALRVLCNLILEDEKESSVPKLDDSDTLKRMIGTPNASNSRSKEDGNGDSIFDF
jgi:hypothetical protein